MADIDNEEYQEEVVTEDVFIFNALDRDVKTQAFGNWFKFKPRQVKRMRPEIGAFLDSNKGYLGLIAVSPRFEDPTYAASAIGQAELEAKRQDGINRRVTHLQQQVDNLQVGLRRDLDTQNIKADVSAFASNGDLNAIDELLGYQKQLKDQDKIRADRARVGLSRLKHNQSARINPDKSEKEGTAPATPATPVSEG